MSAAEDHPNTAQPDTPILVMKEVSFSKKNLQL